MKRKVALAVGIPLVCASILCSCKQVQSDSAVTETDSVDRNSSSVIIYDASEDLNLTDIYNQYNAGELTYEEVSKKLSAYKQMHGDSSELADIKKKVNKLKGSKKVFEVAQKAEESGDEKTAYLNYLYVIEEDSNYEVANSRKNEIASQNYNELAEKATESYNQKKYQDALNYIGQAYYYENNDNYALLLQIVQSAAKDCGFKDATPYFVDIGSYSSMRGINIKCSNLNKLTDKEIDEKCKKLEELLGSNLMDALGDKSGISLHLWQLECDEKTKYINEHSWKDNRSTSSVSSSSRTSSSSASKPKTYSGPVTQEYKNALSKAIYFATRDNLSKKAIYAQLTSDYGGQFPADAAQYAIDNLTGIDWSANALAQAKYFYTRGGLSKSAVYDQLTSEYGGQFTASEAQYAIDHLD